MFMVIKMKIKIILLLLSVTAAGIAATITATKTKKETPVNISFLKGPSGMGGAYLWNKSDAGETKDSYNITLDTHSDQVGEKLAAGVYDIACIPANIAYELYKSSYGKVKIAAVTTLGMLRIVSRQGEVSNIRELENRTILSAGKGTVVEYVLKFLLEKNNIKATIEFTSEHSETVRKALQGEYDTLLLPEPFASQIVSADSDFSVSVDINEEWKDKGGSVLTMGCIAVNTDFYKGNKKKVKNFVEEYRRSVEFINNNTENGAIFIDAHNIMSAAVAKKAIPKCNIVCMTGKNMEVAMSLCEEFFTETDGQIPDDDMFIMTE